MGENSLVIVSTVRARGRLGYSDDQATECPGDQGQEGADHCGAEDNPGDFRPVDQLATPGTRPGSGRFEDEENLKQPQGKGPETEWKIYQRSQKAETLKVLILFLIIHLCL